MQMNKPDITEHFDLLEISWWQNPWYWVALLFVLLFLTLGICWWYYAHRVRLTPEEKIIQRLARLRLAAADTQAEQKAIYGELTQLIKEFTAYINKRPIRDVLSLTDHEYRESMAEKLPEAIRTASLSVLESAAEVKFADAVTSSAELYAHIDQLSYAYTRYREEVKAQRKA